MDKYEIILAQDIGAAGGEHIEVFSCNAKYHVISNFTAEELSCPLARRGKFDVRFLRLLGKLRAQFGSPMKVNSCARSHQHNVNVGGHKRSLHLMDNPAHPTLGAIAADISILGWPDVAKRKLINLAHSLDFSIGIGQNFIHLDARGEIGLTQTRWEY